MAAQKKIEVTEELITLNPEVLKDAKLGTKVAEEGLNLPQKIKPGATNDESVPPVEDHSIEAIMARINRLESENAAKDAKIAMLEDVADKGRVLNYQSKNNPGKKEMRANISIVGNNSYLVGWRTMKDELIKHPTSGLTIGESQEFELMILKEDDTLEKITVNGYPAFSNTRYDKRVEVEVISKEEDFDGNVKFKVKLPDGRIIGMRAEFLN